MLFVSIQGKKHKELTFDELCSFFVDRAFFAFMQDGRAAFREVAREIVINHGHWLFERDSARFLNSFSNDEMFNLTSRIEMILIDGFIVHGSKGLRTAIIDAHTAILDAYIAEGKKKRG